MAIGHTACKLIGCAKSDFIERTNDDLAERAKIDFTGGTKDGVIERTNASSNVPKILPTKLSGAGLAGRCKACAAMGEVKPG